jgi:hypothetical protein
VKVVLYSIGTPRLCFIISIHIRMLTERSEKLRLSQHEELIKLKPNDLSNLSNTQVTSLSGKKQKNPRLKQFDIHVHMYIQILITIHYF